MKIAIVGPAHPYKGGSAQHTTALAHHLSDAGHELWLESWRRQYPKFLYPGQLTIDEPETELFARTERSLDWHRPDGWRRSGRRLAATDLDAVVLALFSPVQVPAYLVLARAARAGGARIIALCHNVLPHEPRRFDRPAMRAMLRAADAVVVHSADEARLAATLTDAPVEVASLPLHLPGVEAAARPAAGAPDRRNRLLFFGMVRQYKGVDLLLRALAAARPAVALTIAGEIWEGREQLYGLIGDLGLGDRVTISEGYVPVGQVPAIFESADALVLPYRSGTASQNALIAFQFGLPVIATRAGAVADAVVAGVNGLLCAPDDVGDLTQAIEALYKPGVLERLRAGIRAPDSKRAWESYVRAIERAIDPDLASPGRDVDRKSA
jgi:glycosyltransferase involved in cell wall biosynthesis